MPPRRKSSTTATTVITAVMVDIVLFLGAAPGAAEGADDGFFLKNASTCSFMSSAGVSGFFLRRKFLLTAYFLRTSKT